MNCQGSYRPSSSRHQRARERTDLEQAVPVRVVAGQAGDLQAEHDAGPAHPHLRHQALAFRSAAEAAEWHWSESITTIWEAGQPRAMAR